MVKKLHILIFFLAHFLSEGEISAQPPGEIKEYIRNRFESYCQSVPWEEIYLQTDRKEYLAGEELWFKIFLIDRQSSLLSAQSSIAYFELLNGENRPVVQKRLRLASGMAPGQVLLPDSLSTGMYTIRVYTNWMKNFLPANCYMEEINIYNPFNIKSFKRKIYNPAIGNAGILNGAETTGSVNQININVARLSTGDTEISIHTEDAYRQENGEHFLLFIQTHGKIDRISTETTTGALTRITIPDSSLTAGINHITIFNAGGKPVCEKLIYTPSPDRKRNLTIHTADSFNTRSKMEFGFELPEGYASGNISIAVAPAEMSGNGEDIDDYLIFGSEFGLLPSGITGRRVIGDTDRALIDSLLGSLKSSWLSWDKILSDDLPLFKYEIEKDKHQIVGLLVTEDQQLGYPGEKIVLSTPGKVAQFQYAVTNYEGNFEFSVPVDYNVRDLIMQSVDTVRNYRIFIESSFSDSYYQADIIIDSIPDSVTSSVSRWSINYQTGKIYSSSYTGDIISPFADELPVKRFYGKPDVEIVLNDFIRLSTMEEIFFELIPRVSLKKNRSSYEIQFLNISGENLYDEPPVMMIDGVVYNNASVIARLDPDVVEKIDVIRGVYHVGNFAFYGIVNVITNAGDFLRFSLPEYATRLSYKVVEPALEFVSPDYDDNGEIMSRNPDFRNTLYWNPLVKPDKEGRVNIEFWSSDLTSDYDLNVLCTLANGQVLSTHKVIKVRNFRIAF